MADSADDAGSATLDAAEAFALLGNATRLEIVDLLHNEVEPPVSFSTLYEHVEMDDSAQFNYHLKKLRPHFVSKADDGYELTSAGERIAMAVTAGTYTDTPTIEPFAAAGACYACGAETLRAAYENEWLTIDCTSCETEILSVQTPPTIVRDREPAAVLEAFDRWSLWQVEQATRGNCPNCGGPVEPDVIDVDDDSVAFDSVAAFDCRVCGRQVVTSFGGIASLHPIVESFHSLRGVSLEDTYYWEIDQFISGEHVGVLSEDPWLVRVSFYADGDACHVDIDDSLEVVETTIVPGAES